MGAWNLKTQTNDKDSLGGCGGRGLVPSNRDSTILKWIDPNKAVIKYPTGGLLFQRKVPTPDTELIL